MTSLKGLTIIVALLACGTSPAMAQSTVPSKYVLAAGVFIVRPGVDMLWHWRILHRQDAIHHGTWGATTASQKLVRTE
jgi:hypothetical protein